MIGSPQQTQNYDRILSVHAYVTHQSNWFQATLVLIWFRCRTSFRCRAYVVNGGPKDGFDFLVALYAPSPCSNSY